jgi:serine phosphatase RsbU (regulator of sigma subunit)
MVMEDALRSRPRLAAVAETALLDTIAEGAFDDLTRLAGVLVSAPQAFATILDDRRAFFKSAFGLGDGGPREIPVEESFCKIVVRSRRELIVTDAINDARTHDHPAVTTMGVRAWAGFPLVAPDGEILGSFCVVDTRERTWSERDIDVLRTLAAAASREIALRSALVNERRLRLQAEALTHTLQASLLPPMLPVVPGLDIAARFHAAGNGIELVGDFYDLFEVRRGRWNFVVGDVSGKGVEAAKAASLARHVVGVAATQRSDPMSVLQLLNDTFLARREAPDLFLTAAYGTFVLTEAGCSLRLASAGHCAPIVRRADGSVTMLPVRGSLIGVVPTLDLEETLLHLTAGDSLIVYTDGVTEARNGHTILGDDALVALIRSAEPSAHAAALAERIESAALRYSGGTASDDIAILVLRVPVTA